MTTTIRVAEPRDLLALIPYQLGFRPQESLVAVSLSGAARRVGLVARVDLAALEDPVGGPEVASVLVSHLVRDGAERIVLVLYTASDLRPGSGDAARGAVGRVHRAADRLLPPAAGEVPERSRECWVVTPTGWFGLDCDDTACCPPGGRPTEELQGTALGAEMVLRGAGVVGDRAQLGDVGRADPADRRSARRAASRWAARGAGPADSAQVRAWRRDGLELWHDALRRARTALADDLKGPLEQAAPLRPTALGRLRAALDDVLVRDAVLLSMLPGQGPVAHRVVAGDTGSEVGDALRVLVDPRDGLPPEEGTPEAAARVLRSVAAHAGLRGHAPSFTLLAVLAWWTGDGARAAVLVERALEVHPGYRLARLVEDALAHGMPPGWLARSGTQACGAAAAGRGR